MTHPKRVDSFDPAYLEMFTRASEGQEFSLPCESRGKATYLTQRLRAYRKLILTRVEKDKSLIPAAAAARMVEISQDGSTVIVRQLGGNWTSKVVAEALMKTAVAVETKPIDQQVKDDLIGPPALPKRHGYY